MSFNLRDVTREGLMKYKLVPQTFIYLNKYLCSYKHKHNNNHQWIVCNYRNCFLIVCVFIGV